VADVDTLNNFLRDRRVSSCFLNPPPTDQLHSRSRLVQYASVWRDEGRVQFTGVCRNNVQGLFELTGAARIEQGQLSYFIAPDRWMLGFGFELVNAVCFFARKHLALEKLYARVLRENVASRRILERLGFVFCGLAYRNHTSRPGYFAVLHYKLPNRL
jgi:RimJ/RimL family protein N-acetyltransferase